MHFLALILALVVGPAHGFDYQFGSWNVNVSRLTHAPSGAVKWVTYRGTHTVTPFWNGRANIGVLEVRGAAGSIEGMQLRLFDPATQQWHLSFASGSDGELQSPSSGSFRGDVGEFRSTEIVGGRRAIVRSISQRRSATTYRDTISRSFDNGRTWTTVWIARYQKAAK